MSTRSSTTQHGWRIALAALLLTGAAGCAGPDLKPGAKSDDGSAAETAQGAAELAAAGDQLEHDGDLNGALVDYVKALGANPNDADLHYRVARVHAALGNDRIAQQAYLAALKLQPEHVDALEGLGLLLLRNGQPAQARPLLLKVIAKEPSRWRALNGLGIVLDLKGDHSAAQALFSKALTLRPDDAELLNNLGFSLYQSGNLNAAGGYLARAIAVRPDYANAWSNLGLLLTRRGDYDNGVKAFEHAMDRPSAYYSAAYVCIADGRLSAAETLLKHAIKDSPTYYVAAHQALDQLYAREQDNRRVQ